MLSDGSYVGQSVVLGERVAIGRNAVVDGEITLSDGVIVGHGAVIEGRYEIGEGTVIGHHTVLLGTGLIGRANQIGPHCTIGTPAQRHEGPEPGGEVIIGSNNTIREYTTIHQPFETTETRIGDDCYMMAYCHIAHDDIIHNNVILANQTILGGSVTVEDYAHLGFGVLVHQFCQIGAYCMVEMGGVVFRDVLPFVMMVDQSIYKLNLIGLSRRGVSQSDIQAISSLYQRFRPSYLCEDDTWYGRIISNFCKRSTKGYYFPDIDWQEPSKHEHRRKDGY